MYTIESVPNSDLDRIAMLEMARLCYACGICVGDCPAARFSDDFNPRQIFLKVCLGIEEGLTGVDSPIWKCTTCYTCYERCPAGVKPLDVIIALRNLSFEAGSSPDSVRSIRKNVLEKGVAGALTQKAVEQRKGLGLPVGELRDQKELETFGFWKEETYCDLLACQKGNMTEDEFKSKYHTRASIQCLDMTGFTETAMETVSKLD